MRTIFILLTLVSSALALDSLSDVNSGNFTEESHPDTTENVQKNGEMVSYIRNGSWLKFAGFNFGSIMSNITEFRIEAANGNPTNGTLRLRLGSPTGPDIGSLEISPTGSWSDFKRFQLHLSKAVSGTHALYFMCEGGGDYLFDLGVFRFEKGGYDRDSDVAAVDYSTESHPDVEEQVKRVGKQLHNLQTGNWVSYQNYDFANGAEYLWIEGAAAAEAGGMIDVRVGSPTAAILGRVKMKPTGSWSSFKPVGCKLTSPIVGTKDLYLTFSGKAGNLFNLGKFRFQRLAPDYKAPETMTDWVTRDLPICHAAGSFTDESQPGDDQNIRSEKGSIGYIGDGQWVRYQNYDVGFGANALTIYGSSKSAGGTVEVRVGHPTDGPPIAVISILKTGSFDNSLPFTSDLAKPLSGIQDIYFKFVGSGWGFYNIQKFRFQSIEPGLKSTGRFVAAHLFDKTSTPAVTTAANESGISHVIDGSWIAYENFNFTKEANRVTVTAATPNRGGRVDIYLDSPSGPCVGSVEVTYTGSWAHFREYTAALSQTITGTHHVFLRFRNSSEQSGGLFNLKEFIFEKKIDVPVTPTHEDTLHVYDTVPGLDPSPYYTYSVQKVSALNAPLKQNATNWESPFAWFSECKGGDMAYSTAYYQSELAGWSQTYCNFELGKNTPIVVKISRKNNTLGAPSGPIFMANAHPAHKVQSCEVIDGEVYVTLSEPALVTIDIDGQMDTRDAPRSSPAEMASSKPYASREMGCHAASIFANPLITDKPVIGAPGVKVINPGDPLPAYDDPSWSTLYFGKGVHHFSRNADGSPRIWKNGDSFILMSDKTCYIPGDAMIYGNFDGTAEKSEKHRVRVYGYGTVSAALMPHWQDPYWALPEQVGTDYKDRGISMSSGFDCRFEGVTLADPANHGVAFDFGANNSRRWMKQVSWRANSDMGGIPGVVEDCFFRLQDDGPYVVDQDYRRNTLWFDCNGSPFRGSFMFRGSYSAEHHTIMEDCDVIYTRANWGGSVISANDYSEVGTYADGTKNTGQHLVFRNIRVTDPRPTRSLFEMNGSPTLDGGIAGIRFENIEYRHPNSWGKKSSFTGSAKSPIHHCYFDQVSLNGRLVDGKLLADPAFFQIEKVSNIIFKASVLKPRATFIPAK
jgi:Carbohydrate binding module (family 6)